MEVEYTEKARPQWNHLVDLDFAKLAKKGKAMMNKAHLLQDMRLRLCKEAFVCIILLNNWTNKTINRRTMIKYEHFYNKK